MRAEATGARPGAGRGRPEPEHAAVVGAIGALSGPRHVGTRGVDLTSRPSREAAKRLYRRLGFEPRDTNVYRPTR